MFPHHLNEAGFDPTIWRTVTRPEQMVVDLRSKEEKELIRQNQNTRTLRRDYDIW